MTDAERLCSIVQSPEESAAAVAVASTTPASVSTSSADDEARRRIADAEKSLAFDKAAQKFLTMSKRPNINPSKDDAHVTRENIAKFRQMARALGLSDRAEASVLALTLPYSVVKGLQGRRMNAQGSYEDVHFIDLTTDQMVDLILKMYDSPAEREEMRLKLTERSTYKNMSPADALARMNAWGEEVKSPLSEQAKKSLLQATCSGDETLQLYISTGQYATMRDDDTVSAQDYAAALMQVWQLTHNRRKRSGAVAAIRNTDDDNNEPQPKRTKATKGHVVSRLQEHQRCRQCRQPIVAYWRRS
jgi:hypothetical protein